MRPNYPHNFTLEEYANVVWTACRRGREAAYNGFPASAIAYMNGLAQVVLSQQGPASLRNVAASGAQAIHMKLTGGTRINFDTTDNGGSAA